MVLTTNPFNTRLAQDWSLRRIGEGEEAALDKCFQM